MRAKIGGQSVRVSREASSVFPNPMKKLFACAAFALSVTTAFSADRIHVLIVDGFSNHDWQLTTAFHRGIVEPTQLFDVSVSTAPPKADAPGWDAWRPKFADYDVVIQNCNDINGGPA